MSSALRFAKAACDSLMAQYSPEQLPPSGRWHYHQGIFLQAMLQVWKLTGEEKYLSYPKQYVDSLVDAQGNLVFARDELDALMPGQLLLELHKHTGETKYRAAADKLRCVLHTLNRTSEGGFWHKDNYPHNMWLDGLYMGGVFAVQYAQQYQDEGLISQVLAWERLMHKHMHDPRSGLLYHAWDESRQAPWANVETGCSPEFWARSIGWYAMALGDLLESLPEQQPGRETIVLALGNLVEALVRYQDAKTGLWYQVVDKGEHPDNWLEHSGSSLFVYAIAKAVKHGAVSITLLEAAKAGLKGLCERTSTDDYGRLSVSDICIGTSAGDFDYYVRRPISTNDLHGVGAFVLACTEMTI